MINKFCVDNNDIPSIYESCLSIPEYVELLGQGMKNKTDLYGDHKGSWQGVPAPQWAEPGIAGVVDLILRSRFYYTPEQFGFDPSIDKNIYKPLCDCLQACKNNNGGVIYVKHGDYLLSNSLRIFKNTVLIFAKGTTLTATDTCNTMLYNGDAGEIYEEYNGQGNIIIQGGTWISNSCAYSESTRNIFGIARANDILIDNVIFKNVKSSHAIDLNSSKNVLINKCRFEGFKNSDALDRGYSEAIQICEHIQVGFANFGAFDGTPCQNITVSNCYFGKSDYYPPWGTGVGNHASCHNKYNTNIKVINNYFEDLTYCGVRSFKWVDTLIQGNSFKNCASGVHISSVKGGLESSKDENGLQTGISQSGKNNYILNNTFINCSRQDIYGSGQYTAIDEIALIDNIIVKDNIFEKLDKSLGYNAFIDLRYCKNLIIESNRINTGYRGIWIRHCNNLNINHNIITNVANEFIYCNEDDGTPFENLDYCRNYKIDNNILDTCDRTGINFENVKCFEINDNYINNTANYPINTRHCISISTSCEDGLICNNYTGKENTNNLYGVYVTDTCTNIKTFNNSLYGNTGNNQIFGSTNFDGYIATNGNNKYKVDCNGTNIVVTQL